ncbi:MAG: hypothetical protein CVU47_04975 [Chloroflexi bacterium HGW-Chloroflexi-9]|nr:MAG: hypothetical protein CVU47_04975 [Chloroflexi bacterium HGW-Chloroflexi-9]
MADTEIIVDPEAPDFSAVVTFVSRSEVTAAVQDCFMQVAVGVLEKRRDSELLKRLLEHPEQRFRFQYVLGNIRTSETSEAEPGPGERERIDRSRSIVLGALDAIRTFVMEVAEDIRDDLRQADETITPELLREEIETEIEQLLGSDEVLQDHVATLVDEMQERFDLITVGEIEVEENWPVRWHWRTSDRGAFIEEINHFSSNYAARFGTLLTPLVNGVRVRGPFVPNAMPTSVRGFSLIDVEGLGHTPESSASVSARLVDYFESVDSILLVDNGTQPMQAASIAAIRAVLTSGHIEKLVLAFSHLDQVLGDNLTSIDEREEHVLSSVENVVIKLGTELATQDEQRLRQRVDEATVMLGGIHLRLNAEVGDASRTLEALGHLLALICYVPAPPDPSEARPIYDRAQFEEATREAGAAFRRRWKGLLGREDVPGVPKEHWARVKALTRRLSGLDRDEYADLKPVADLVTATREALYRVVRHPKAWHPIEPPEATRNEILDRFTTEISIELGRIARRWVWLERRREWSAAYAETGKGSTYVRARIIDAEVFEQVVPLDGVAHGVDLEIADALTGVSGRMGIVLR